MTDKIKVCHVITDMNVGGAGRWLVNYLKYYDKEKYDATVLVPEGSALIPLITDLGADITPLKGMDEKSLDIKSFGVFKKYFKNSKPDIVHTHASITARAAAKNAKVPVIVNSKHWIEGSEKSGIKRNIKNYVNNNIGVTVAVSEAVKKSVIEAGVNAENVYMVYNGIEPIKPLGEFMKYKIREELGINDNEKVVGIVARLEKAKDHETFLMAAAEVLKTRDDVKFLVIGDGSLMDELKTMSKQLLIDKNVVFTGYVREVEKLEALLDISVITSRNEALCLSILESMSIGVPAIGTDVGGIPEVIKNGETGFLVPAGDYKGIASKIDTLLSGGTIHTIFATRCMKLVEEKFTAKKMVSEIESIYSELIRA